MIVVRGIIPVSMAKDCLFETFDMCSNTKLIIIQFRKFPYMKKVIQVKDRTAREGNNYINFLGPRINAYKETVKTGGTGI